jgi:hypothetical protein
MLCIILCNKLIYDAFMFRKCRARIRHAIADYCPVAFSSLPTRFSLRREIARFFLRKARVVGSRAPRSDRFFVFWKNRGWAGRDHSPTNQRRRAMVEARQLGRKLCPHAIAGTSALGQFPHLRFRLLVTDCCLIPMHEREQKQHPGTDQYRSHCRGVNARQ